MTVAEILAELEQLGRASYKNVLLKHGVIEPCAGVKIEDLKKIRKRIGRDYQLALNLFATGHYDAQYLAGLIAHDARMTKRDLNVWLRQSKSIPLAGCTVAWVAAGSPHGWELALTWIEASEVSTSVAGWATISALVGIRADAGLDLPVLAKLLGRVGQTIHQQADRVRYAMNNCVIAIGAHVQPLHALAMETAERIGVVTVDMGETACRVPFAPDYLRKIELRGANGKKRKSAKC